MFVKVVWSVCVCLVWIMLHSSPVMLCANGDNILSSGPVGVYECVSLPNHTLNICVYIAASTVYYIDNKVSGFISALFLITFRLFSIVRVFRSVVLLIGCLLCPPLHAGVRVVIFFFISFFGGWPFLSTVLPLCFHLRSHLGKSIPHYASEWNERYCLFGFLLRSPFSAHEHTSHW